MKRETGLEDWLRSMRERTSMTVVQRVAIIMVATFAWVGWWYRGTVAEMAAIWNGNATFAHGIVVLPIFVWLVWRQRDRLAGCEWRPVPWLAAAAALAGFAWLAAQITSIAAAAHLALVALLAIALVAGLGWQIARVLAFPILFLFFAAPIGDFMIPTLMRYTADFTVAALRLSGVPVFHEGTHLTIPNGRWSVVEACSGVRYLIASLMVGSLYAWLNYRSLKRRVLFMIAAIAVPIVANWMRAYLIVLLGYLSDNRVAAGVDHLIYGWLFFGIVIAILFWIGGRWHEQPLPVAPAALSPEVVAVDARVRRRRWAGLLPAAVVVAAFPLAQRALDRPVPDFTVDLAVPAVAPGWEMQPGAEQFVLQPHYRGQRAGFAQLYREADGGLVMLYVAYFAEQQPGHEMVMWGNQLIEPTTVRWTELSQGAAAVPGGSARRLVVSDGLRRVAAWHWYRVAGRSMEGDYPAKALVSLERVFGGADDSAVIAVMTLVRESDDEAHARLERFVAAHGARLDEVLARAGEWRR